MRTAGTDAGPPIQIDETRRANLDALRAQLPKSAKLIEAASPPDSIEPTFGRDGTPTFAWTDANARRRWLGDSTMPDVSESTLVEQFEPGAGNVVILGIGHGTAIRQMARTLQSHQAIFVIEPDAWRAACALSLHPFADMLRQRRLLLFVGPDAWDHLVDFLIESPGYLIPDRTLAWPWFNRGDVRLLTERLTAIPPRVTQARIENAARDPEAQGAGNALRVFIGSNAPETMSHRWARQWARAARELGGIALCCVPDDPSLMHPTAIERRIAGLRPTLSILVDSAPTQLAFRTHDSPTCIVVTHTNALSPDLVRQIPDSAWLFVRTHAQRHAAADAGVSPRRITLMQPGVASADSEPSSRPGPAGRVIAMGDWKGTEPVDVGIHLGSHQRLWRSARDWIAKHVARYDDDSSADAMAHAEATTNLRIQSDEVRSGLIDRIRSSLGPRIVAETYLMTLAKSNAALTIVGRGWDRHETLAQFAVESSPSLDDGDAPALIWIGTSHHVADRALDWLANGRPVFLRHVDKCHTADTVGEDWSSVIDCEHHVTKFSTVNDLANAVSRFVDDPEPFLTQAAAARLHLTENHAWQRRLTDLLRQIGMSVNMTEDER